MAITRLDKITGNHLSSVKADGAVGIGGKFVNGLVFNLGALVEGEGELYEVSVAQTDADLQNEFVFHSTAEVMYDPRKQSLKEFYIEDGDAGRAYHFTRGDIVTLTADLIDGTPVKDQFVTPQLGSALLAPSADGTTVDEAGTGTVTPSLRLQVIEQTTFGIDNDTAYALRVISA